MTISSEIKKDLLEFLFEHKTVPLERFYSKFSEISEDTIRSYLSTLVKRGFITRLERGIFALPSIAQKLKKIADLPEQKVSLHNLLAKKQYSSKIVTQITGHEWKYNEKNKGFVLYYQISKYVAFTVTITNKGLVTVHSHNSDTRGAFSTYEDFVSYENIVQSFLKHSLNINYAKFKIHGLDFAVDDRTIHFSGLPIQKQVLDIYLLKFYQKTEGPFRKELRQLPSGPVISRKDIKTAITRLSFVDATKFMTADEIALEATNLLKDNKRFYKEISNQTSAINRGQDALTHELRSLRDNMRFEFQTVQKDLIGFNMDVLTGNRNSQAILESNLRREGEFERSIGNFTEKVSSSILDMKQSIIITKNELSEKIDNIRTIRTINDSYQEIISALEELKEATTIEIAAKLSRNKNTIGPRLSEMKKKKLVRKTKTEDNKTIWRKY